MYIYVYKITNLINKKEYIGVHTSKLPNDRYFGSGILIKKAIKKYGKEFFLKEIIKYCNSLKEAYDLEHILVNENYIKSINSYNLCLGGNIPPSNKGKKLSENTINKLKLYANTSKGKEKSSKGGKKRWKNNKTWYKESINKRIKTRKFLNNYSNNMSQCHTPKAIIKRNNTRLKNGVKYNTKNAHNLKSKFKREQTKIIILIKKIEIFYNKSFSLNLLKIARKDKFTYLQDKSILKYFKIPEISPLSYDDMLSTSICLLDNQ